MAAHLRPRVQATTSREGRSEPTWRKPAAVKCSGLLGGKPACNCPNRRHQDEESGNAELEDRGDPNCGSKPNEVRVIDVAVAAPKNPAEGRKMVLRGSVPPEG